MADEEQPPEESNEEAPPQQEEAEIAPKADDNNKPEEVQAVVEPREDEDEEEEEGESYHGEENLYGEEQQIVEFPGEGDLGVITYIEPYGGEGYIGEEETYRELPGEEEFPPAPSEEEIAGEEYMPELMEEQAPLEEEAEEEEEEALMELEDKHAKPQVTLSVDEAEEKIRLSGQVVMKTPSEILFDQEEREKIEENMRKLIKEPITKPDIEMEHPRRPIEKEKLSLTELELSGLYQKPTILESAKSMIFDEEKDEGKPRESVIRVLELLELSRLVENAMVTISERIKHRTDSIFIKNDEDSINRLQKFIEDTIQEKMTEDNIQERVEERLAGFNQALREAVAITLQEMTQKKEYLPEKLKKYEEEPKRMMEETKTKKLTKKEEAAVVKIQESMLSVKREESEVGVEEEPTIEGKVSLEAMEIEIGEEEEEEAPEALALKLTESERGAVKPVPSTHLSLTSSEKLIPLDEQLRQEMDEYIEKKKQAYLREMEIQEAKIKAEERFASKDPEVMLANVNLTVTIKFIINTGDIFTCAYRFFMTFWEIKEDLAGIFRIPPDVMLIYDLEGKEIPDESIVKDLEIEPFQSTKLRLQTLDSDKFPLESWHLELPVPDIITVTVETGKDHHDVPEYKEVVVEIIDRKIRKPFVGGYRDPETGLEYHHAFTQSAPHAPYLPVERRNHRDTQTAFTRRRKMDTLCNRATQMWRRDCYITSEHDKIMTAKPYVDYEQSERNKDLEGKVRTIQRYLRAYIIRKFAKQLSEEYRRRKAWEEEQERKRLEERENKIRSDIINMSFPKTKADFDMLYAMVERWRKAQVERISKLKTEAPKKAEFCALLEKEIKLLESIEVHRINVLNEKRRKRNLQFMEKVSKPVEWTGYNGMTISMDTIRTQRARELKELYQSLSRDDLTYKQRIEILMALKYALKIHNTRLTIEIQDLLNRECDLLIRGVQSTKLDYLRRRTEALFVQFFKEVDFNPEVAKYSPDYNKEPYRNNIVFCKLCQQMKMKNHFCATARDKDIKICSSCTWVHNTAVPRIDLNPYRRILRAIRRDEQKRSCYSSTAFILQDEDIYFLVQNIWHSISVVSGNDNLVDLRLPRWNADLDWTPWNCILLTDVEAKAHLKVENLNTYEPDFIKTVHSKHLLAKNQFKQLMACDQRMRDSGVWANVVDSKKYVPPPKTADIIFDDGAEDISNYKKCIKPPKYKKEEPIDEDKVKCEFDF